MPWVDEIKPPVTRRGNEADMTWQDAVFYGSNVASVLAMGGSWISVHRTPHRKLWLGMFSGASVLMLAYALSLHNAGFILMEFYFTVLNIDGLRRCYSKQVLPGRQ